MDSFFHDTTLTTPFLGLTQDFARYFQLFMIFEVYDVSKMSVTLTTGDNIVVLVAGRFGRGGIARCVALVFCASPATLVTYRAHVSSGHSRRQVRDNAGRHTGG